MQHVRPTILALDLEGTLISNAISQIPRPGLYRFLEDIQGNFERLVMFTTVPEDRFRTIATLLAAEGSAPDWFARLHCICWSGKTKDLRDVSRRLGDALLLDDYRPYVHLGQERFWVHIPSFESPYTLDDNGLSFARQKLLERIVALGCNDQA